MKELSLYDQLNDELRKAGVENARNSLGYRIDPIEAVVKSTDSCKPFVEILMKYLKILRGSEREMVVRALTQKRLKNVAAELVNIMKNDREEIEARLHAIGNALYVINDKSQYPEIMEICKMKELGTSREMLMGTLAKIKTVEAYELLIYLLDDKSVRLHAISALGRLGNVDAIPILESLESKTSYERKQVQAAIKKLNN